jgi:5-methyltetrahydropteroyltriglutamate--homocysteine methyltransferase
MTLLPTSLVGSYPQPDWLIDREKLSHQMPPRVRAAALWRVAPDTDGEMRRESYSNRFATALEGVDLENPGTVTSRSGHAVTVPRIIGKIRRKYPVQVRDMQFLRANTDRLTKITVPGPFTMSQQAQNDFYPTVEDMAVDYAAAVNAEIKDLFAAGADVVQIDEPWMEARPEEAQRYGLAALKRAVEGVHGAVALHICFGYAALVPGRPPAYSFLEKLADAPVQQISIETAQSKLDCSVLAKLPKQTIVLGVIDLSTPEVESPQTVATRIERALPFVSPERLVIATDCGMKYLPTESAFGKMQAMVAGAKIVREQIQAGVRQHA